MDTNACNLVALTADSSSTCDALTHGLKVLGEGSMKAGLFRFGEVKYQEGYGIGLYYGIEQGIKAGRYEGIAISFGIVAALALSYGAYRVITSKLAARLTISFT